MDLISAKVEAAKASRDKRKKMYINVDDEGECIISSIPAKDTDKIQAVFVNGSQVPLEDHLTNINETKQETKMETKTAKKSAPAKKTAAKKVEPAKKATAKPAKKVAAKGAAPAGLGKQTTLAIKDIIKRVKAGEKAYNKDVKPLPIGYLEKMVDKNKEIQVQFVKA
jgi:hypothetical protein